MVFPFICFHLEPFFGFFYGLSQHWHFEEFYRVFLNLDLSDGFFWISFSITTFGRHLTKMTWFPSWSTVLGEHDACWSCYCWCGPFDHMVEERFTSRDQPVCPATWMATQESTEQTLSLLPIPKEEEVSLWIKIPILLSSKPLPPSLPSNFIGKMPIILCNE